MATASTFTTCFIVLLSSSLLQSQPLSPVAICCLVTHWLSLAVSIAFQRGVCVSRGAGKCNRETWRLGARLGVVIKRVPLQCLADWHKHSSTADSTNKQRPTAPPIHPSAHFDIRLNEASISLAKCHTSYTERKSLE